MRKTAVIPAVLSILLCGVLQPSHARQPNSSQQPVPQAQSKFQTFGGRVVSQNAVRLVLKDYDNDIWYHIDDQQKAGSFLGKNVLVTGAFDGLTGTIRVQNIVEATPEQISAANTERIKQNTPPPPPKSVPPPAVAANAPSSAPPRANPPQPVAPRVEARTPPASEARRPARVEAPINSSPPSPRPAAAAPSPSISLPEEAVSASATVAISSHRSIPMPHNFNSQRPSAKDLVVGKLVRRVSPSYPVEAKQQGIEGTVRLRAVIGADGNVQSVQPVSGPEPLVAAAVTAVREWRYGPTVLDGRRIPVQDDISLVFRLPD
jgi:TonB family protein